MVRRGITVLVAASALVRLAGCGGNTSGNTLAECRPLTATSSVRPRGWTGTVFTIVMENHNREQIVGSKLAPYITSLALEYAEAAGYHDSYVHPSNPNYIWMVAGQNFGILDNDDPRPGKVIMSQSHIADQIEKAGLTWKTYQESMGAPCGLVSHGTYAVKHNPFAYFADINGWDGTTFQPSARCQEHIVDYTELDADLASGNVPDYVFITPNLLNDMHDGTVQDGDRWLSHEVPKILASDAFKNGGVLFLTWDEGYGQDDDPPFIAISPHASRGFVSQADYDASSYLKTVQAMLGVEELPCVTAPEAVSTMNDLFTMPLAPAQ
jgi:phosphatidylinositol-3-phosphatase